MLKMIGLCALALSPLLAQEAIGLRGYDGSGSRLNEERIRLRRVQAATRSLSADPKVVVFIGDRVIPQFVDGDSWLTAITLVNLENHPVSFDVLFFADDGTDLVVPVVGQGLVRGMQYTLPLAGSATFQTAGTGLSLSSGWALLSQANTTDSIGMFAIFRQALPGRQAQEAVVPSVNQFSGHFVLPFDNTLYITGIAIANPTINTVSIPVTMRNEAGVVIDRRSLSLGPYSHTAFSLPTTWASTAGLRGAIEFLTTGFGVGALGLRFNGAAFTSFSVLENFAWTQR